jgi:Putative ATPase subunit of terminase (gpP-like)
MVTQPTAGQGPAPTAALPSPSQTEQELAVRRMRRMARWEEARNRRAAGYGIARIAREIGMHRRTVRYWAKPSDTEAGLLAGSSWPWVLRREMNDTEVAADPFAHLKRRAAERADRTVERLRAGIAALQEDGKKITAESLRQVTRDLEPGFAGLSFQAIRRNPRAYALYRESASAFTALPTPEKSIGVAEHDAPDVAYAECLTRHTTRFSGSRKGTLYGGFECLSRSWKLNGSSGVPSLTTSRHYAPDCFASKWRSFSCKPTGRLLVDGVRFPIRPRCCTVGRIGNLLVKVHDRSAVRRSLSACAASARVPLAVKQ